MTRQGIAAEDEFRDLAKSQGWDVTKRGWPDFLCRRNGELMAVEVKGPHDGLSPEQYETISDLRRAGIPTFVWGPREGYTEVGPPVGESVFSLMATIAMMREAALVKERPAEADETVVMWEFDPVDAESLTRLRHECRKNHPEHMRKQREGGLCADVWVEARQHPVEAIADGRNLSTASVQRILRNVERFLFRHQHERLHREIGAQRACTTCRVAM